MKGINQGDVDLEVNQPPGDWLLESANEISSSEINLGVKPEFWILYFDSFKAAESALDHIKNHRSEIFLSGVEEKPDVDWVSEWKKSFKSFSAPPFWNVIPEWEVMKTNNKNRFDIIINPGSAFGTGEHETTQLCLEILGKYFNHNQESAGSRRRAIDFGSGSGILAIAMSSLGFNVNAVEIDPVAVENARGNIAINGASDYIELNSVLNRDYENSDLVVANILKRVLLAESKNITDSIKPGGSLVLSGLLKDDEAEIVEQFEPLMGGRPSEKITKNEWIALFWRARLLN